MELKSHSLANGRLDQDQFDLTSIGSGLSDFNMDDWSSEFKVKNGGKIVINQPTGQILCISVHIGWLSSENYLAILFMIHLKMSIKPTENYRLTGLNSY